uniref:ATP-binding cassette sub-family C member 9-like n=1 Tax=Saccoglossus kowalevskii TaxID=10224 RepID=A0ABM0MVQ9_SACKO|nr:PREDICTED: ATP-binding cassette sub-family C member 9-like [Saccoglossus kowalevskii]
MTTFAVSWFCADNYTYETITDNHRRGLADQCLAELVCVCIHGLLIVVMSTTLCILGCCTVLRYLTSPTIVLYPGHNVKWILSIVIWLVLLCSLGEGVLTDLTRNPVTQPHLYIPPTVALTSMIITLTYYHHMEYWDVPRMSWLLVIYWAFSLVGEAMKLSNLYSQFGLDITILRLFNTLLLALLYASCLLIEFNVIRTMVFGWYYSRPRYPSELNNPDMLLSHKYTNLVSRSLFYSLKWLLKLGYRKPLEMSDLGCLPQEFHCKYQYHVFEKAYGAEKEKVRSNNKKPSLWKTYMRGYGYSILFSTTLKFISDLLNFIPPLAIGGIVAYATRVYYEEDISNDTQTVFITVGEFFSNGYVLVAVVFVSVIIKGVLLQASSHATVIPGFKIRMNLQVLFALLLLYLELGISAFIGSLLLFVVSPIQYKIITKMSEIQFCVLSFADERLKKSNELLQSMKLLKLYGWEEIFSSIIESIRSSEVGQIVRTGVCVIISTFLAQSTPVISTFITFAIYSKIGPSPLTPELAFSALALFNHLAMPLLELPNAISETVNAIISTRRFQNLFDACEVSEYVHGRPLLSKGFNDVSDSMGTSDDNSGKKQLSVAYNGHSSEHERDDLVHLIHDTPPHYGTFESESTETPVTDIPDHLSIQINSGSFAWDKDEEAVLTNINLNIPTVYV